MFANESDDSIFDTTSCQAPSQVGVSVHNEPTKRRRRRWETGITCRSGRSSIKFAAPEKPGRQMSRQIYAIADIDEDFGGVTGQDMKYSLLEKNLSVAVGGIKMKDTHNTVYKHYQTPPSKPGYHGTDLSFVPLPLTEKEGWLEQVPPSDKQKISS